MRFNVSNLAVLGMHSLLTQQQSFAVEREKLGEAIKKFGLRKPGNIRELTRRIGYDGADITGVPSKNQ